MKDISGEKRREERSRAMRNILMISVFLIIMPILMYVLFGMLNWAIEGEKEENINSRMESIGLEYTDNRKDLSFGHTFSSGEEELQDGVMYELELETFEEVNLQSSGDFSSDIVYEVGFLNNNKEEQRIQRTVNVHYYQQDGLEPKFVVDGEANPHVWLNTGTLEE